MRGWRKLMGLTPLALFVACACVVASFGLVDAFETHELEEARRSSPPQPRPRKRRRRTLADLARVTAGPPP